MRFGYKATVRAFVPALFISVLMAGCGSTTSPRALYRAALDRLSRQRDVMIVARYDYLTGAGERGATTVEFQAPDRLRFQSAKTAEPLVQVGRTSCVDRAHRTCTRASPFSLPAIAGDLVLPPGRSQSGSIFDTSDAALHDVRFLAGTSSHSGVKQLTVEAYGYPWSCDPLFDCGVSLTALSWQRFHYRGVLSIDAHSGLPLSYRATSRDAETGRVLVQIVSFAYDRKVDIRLP